MFRKSLQTWGIFLVLLVVTIAYIAIFGLDGKGPFTTTEPKVDAYSVNSQVTEVPPNEAGGETHFAPPPEAPMKVQRIPLKQWEAEQRTKSRAIGTLVGHFADRDAALNAVDAAIARHGGKGTFSATFGKNGLVARTDTDGVVVTFS